MPNPGNFSGYGWEKAQQLPARNYVCGYCGNSVSSEKGLPILFSGSSATRGGVYICPSCKAATYFPPGENRQVPGPITGRAVEHVPDALRTLYDEARSCVSADSFTAAVLLCRKMLMHIAVAQGAAPGLSFLEYVNELEARHYVPPNGRVWVDHIRKKSNEANHDIVLMGQADAVDLLTFVQMLLTFIYEFPNRMAAPPSQAAAPKR